MFVHRGEGGGGIQRAWDKTSRGPGVGGGMDYISLLSGYSVLHFDYEICGREF